MSEKIFNKKLLLAIIIRKNEESTGINFYTPDEFSQQVASMNHSKGHLIEPHFHNKVVR